MGDFCSLKTMQKKEGEKREKELEMGYYEELKVLVREEGRSN